MQFSFSDYKCNMRFNFCFDSFISSVTLYHVISKETFNLGAGWDNGMCCPSVKKGKINDNVIEMRYLMKPAVVAFYL